ncbi:HVA1 family protein [Sphingobium sp. H33]|uniref:HVA1 family protein n=1 Tax=Sphingobium nicotianae TaxID=2782607 RepID=A0A9X1AJW9_9SPHN|nr:HVA1 family protein [Sphingobium nicotianae]
MSKGFYAGAAASWAWERGEGHGRVVERFERRVQRTIGGKRIVRKGSPDNPAYLIDTGDAHVLKLGSELHRD